MRVWLERGPLDPRRVEDCVRGTRHGAVVTFTGTVRELDGGRRVEGLGYEAHEALALKELRTIAAEAEARWPGVELAAAHRLGELELGETIVVVAAAAPHRAEAFEACRYCIDQLKARVPIWKRERWAGGGHRWVANPESPSGVPLED